MRLHYIISCQQQTPLTGERSEEHTSELQSRRDLVCRLLLEKKKDNRGHTAHVLERLVRNPVITGQNISRQYVVADHGILLSLVQLPLDRDDLPAAGRFELSRIHGFKACPVLGNGQ